MAGGRVGDNNFSVSDWIVDGSGLSRGASHTTIAAAITDASDNDTIFIRPGTYTEDLTWNKTLTVFAANYQNGGRAIIVGKNTFSSSKDISFTEIVFNSNGDSIVATSGALSGNLNFNRCTFNAISNSTTAFDLQATGFPVQLFDCEGGVTGDTVVFFAVDGSGLTFRNCSINYAGTTLQTCTFTGTGTALTFTYSKFDFPISVSGSSFATILHSLIGLAANNTTALTTAGTGGGYQLMFSRFRSGTASPISIGAGTSVTVLDIISETSNATEIAGTGTLFYANLTRQNGAALALAGGLTSTSRATLVGPISFDGGTNFLSNYVVNTFTPVLNFGGATTGITYTTQLGSYVRIGALVFIRIEILLSSKGTAVGSATIEGLPFTSANDGITNIMTMITPGVSATAGYTDLYASVSANSTSLTLAQADIDSAAYAALSNTNFTNTSTVRVTGFYKV